MRIAKRSAAEEGWGEERQASVGPLAFVRQMYHKFRMYRQWRRIEAYEKELTKKHGPIPPEIKAWGERIEWPK